MAEPCSLTIYNETNIPFIVEDKDSFDDSGDNICATWIHPDDSRKFISKHEIEKKSYYHNLRVFGHLSFYKANLLSPVQWKELCYRYYILSFGWQTVRDKLPIQDPEKPISKIGTFDASYHTFLIKANSKSGYNIEITVYLSGGKYVIERTDNRREGTDRIFNLDLGEFPEDGYLRYYPTWNGEEYEETECIIVKPSPISKNCVDSQFND